MGILEIEDIDFRLMFTVTILSTFDPSMIARNLFLESKFVIDPMFPDKRTAWATECLMKLTLILVATTLQSIWSTNENLKGLDLLVIRHSWMLSESS